VTFSSSERAKLVGAWRFTRRKGVPEVMPRVQRNKVVLLERAKISLLYLYYMAIRIACGKVEPRNRRMNSRLAALGRNFHVRMWRTAAASVGAVSRAEPNGVIEIERADRRIRVRDNVTSLNDPAAVKRAADKAEMQALLAKSGIAVPKRIVIAVGEFERAVHMLEAARCPLVVKPADSTGGGAGVSTDVTDVRRLRTAVAWARTFARRILIEEQVEGDCYRVLIMDGEVIDTVLRHPPRAVGDGVSTIRALIHRENELRLIAAAKRPQAPIRFDVDLRNTLATQGLRLRSRLANGEVVVLKRVTNDNNERENEPANGRLCSGILDAACRAAEIVGARLAGVDVICSDPTAPLEVSGGAIIEVNATPGFYWHSNQDADSSCFAAERVLRKAFVCPPINSRAE
jgi:cyanophycin synthetase